ncbi:hypothetical protein C0J52_24815 [Blattella germanica]|nr:hypothetical protein C0J52_24815 [Blattella germanica]
MLGTEFRQVYYRIPRNDVDEMGHLEPNTFSALVENPKSSNLHLTTQSTSQPRGVRESGGSLAYNSSSGILDPGGTVSDGREPLNIIIYEKIQSSCYCKHFHEDEVQMKYMITVLGITEVWVWSEVGKHHDKVAEKDSSKKLLKLFICNNTELYSSLHSL